MYCKNFWKRIIPFILGLTFGLFVTNILQKKMFTEKNQEKPFIEIVHSEKEMDIFGKTNEKNTTVFVEESSVNSFAGIVPLKIISKPKPYYTDAARQNYVQGKVILQVTFLADGQIGKISAISGLPNGLTEQAVAAAKKIKFKPYTSHGIARDVIKTVQYNFTLY